MAVSVSGVVTLAVLVGIGPIIYACRWIYNNMKGIKNEWRETSEGHDGREEMSSQAYIYALVGYAIGIGNIWRFPYVISQNGGAAALFAYVVSGVFVAGPIFFYEMLLGQHTRENFLNSWTKIRPRWTSFGAAQLLLLATITCYFAMVIAYTLPYIVASCQDPFPWDAPGSEAYWFDTILNRFDDFKTHDGESGLGGIQGQLAGSLLFLWVTIFLAVAFGKSILAKVTYVTVLLPVVLMIIFVGRTIFLEGAGDGIAFYIGKFEGKELLKLEVWATALSQHLFSLSPGMGTAITYASFSRPKEDTYRACMIVALSNSIFSIIGGLGIFSVLGYLAHEKGLPVEEVATRGGAGLAFIVISEAMQFFGPLKNGMAVLFFFMLFTLGLDSHFAMTETLVGAVEEFCEKRGWQKIPTWKAALAVSVCQFLIGLLLTTRMGDAILDVVDHFVGSLFLLVVVFVESIILNVDFGWRRLAYSLKQATKGHPKFPEGREMFPKWWCRLDFHGTVPIMTGGLFLYLLGFDFKNPYDGGSYPKAIMGIGWALLALHIGMIPVSWVNWNKEGTLPPMDEFEEPEKPEKTEERDVENDGSEEVASN